MKFLDHNEKVTLVILVVLSLIMVVVTTYLAIGQQNTNVRTCCNQKVRVVNTGGDVDEGFQAKYEKHRGAIADYDVVAYDPPMRSTDVAPQDWNQIAQDLMAVYKEYDAFVILGGRDTLVYTAAALAFILENLSKPVVLADGDLAGALILASQSRAPEVMIASGDKLLRGCRTVANSTVGFSSPNYPPIDKATSLSPPKESIGIKPFVPGVNIAVVKLFPGIDAEYMASLLGKKDLHGVILEIWGAGHIPSSPEFLQVVNALAKKGVVMVAVSQCDEVRENYETDVRLLEAGVLSGNDMTTAAAYAKLAFLLGNVEDKKLIGKLMEINFRGEVSVPDAVVEPFPQPKPRAKITLKN